MTPPNEQVACTLTTEEAADQLLEWSDLRHHATRIEALTAGAMMRFPAALEPLIDDLVRREAACCAFLDIVTSRSGDELVVEVTSLNADALPVISLLTGVPVE